MNISLTELKKIVSNKCVTIILNTHRTTPDNKKDPLLLKNLVSEAEKRLYDEMDERKAEVLVKKLNQLSSSIDHSHNLGSLFLFVNKDIAEYTRLTIPVKNRAIVDNTFATRDLIRALNRETVYYVLVLSQQKVRLIRALNERALKEKSNPFPMENDLFQLTKSDPSNAQRQRNLIAEFYNRVDKELNNIIKNDPFPVLICSEENNYHEYLNISDNKDIFYNTWLNGNRLEEKPQHIIEKAWPIVDEITVKNNNAKKEKILNAVDKGRFVTDINDILKALREGRVHTLFIEKGKFQPAVLDKNEIIFVKEDEKKYDGIVDDVYDELIEMNVSYGGDTVFLPEGDLEEFDGFVAVTRY